METYREGAPLWDFTSAASGFSQMQDIDFMSLLQKQYELNTAHNENNAGQSNTSGLSLNGNMQSNDQFRNPTASSSRTSPSDDTPSPSGSNDSQQFDEADGAAGKRKATDDAEEGPSSKTMKGATPSTSTSARRKSTGNPAKDETRLLKRKEQNRAAQRAFRERKERHVKDLEDKVAQLEAKNEEAISENENLRDLLSRLQSENMMLKQVQFTFSMPRDNMQQHFSADGTSFPTQSVPSSTGFAAPSSSKSPKATNPLDWSSLTTFDPSRLNLLDDLPQAQPTATDSAMNLDFGFGPSGLASTSPLTTLASNPMFMSFASSFDTPPATTDSSSNQSQGFSFDMNSLQSWPTTQTTQDGSYDDILSGYLPPSNNLDFSTFLSSPASISPVTHHASPPVALGASSTSSPSSCSTDPLFTPKDSPRHDFEGGHSSDQCPKTKAELVKRIEESGPSPFAPACTTGVRKAVDRSLGAMINCEGATSFPKTAKNEKNVEVLSAWRNITSNPMFKDTDISELCAEFTAKARCDGQKVVLEPGSVDSIIETLSKKQQPQSQ